MRLFQKPSAVLLVCSLFLSVPTYTFASENKQAAIDAFQQCVSAAATQQASRDHILSVCASEKAALDQVVFGLSEHILDVILGTAAS